MKPNHSNHPSISGSKMILLHLALVIVAVLFFAYSEQAPFGLLLLALSVAMLKGYFTVKPQEIRYITFFGEYKGYIQQQGLHWINPLLQTKAFSSASRHENLQEQAFCDAQGTSLRINALVSWGVQDYKKAFAYTQDIEAQVAHHVLGAWAHILGKWPYQGKDGQQGLKGNKAQLERAMWQHLQERLTDLGIQVTAVTLSHLAIDDAQYLQLMQEKQHFHLQAQAKKNWAAQAPPLATHIIQQVKETSQLPKLSPQQEQALLEKIITALIK